MSCCANAGTSICQCGGFAFPTTLSNPPGLGAIAYRSGDYASFRRALLRARSGETQLTRPDGKGGVVQVWRPGAHGDLAVQMVEWWAYLADILTFYNERSANEAYLRTAALPESVSRMIGLIGYRPRPALGARGTLAALAVGPDPFTLPIGFPIQSKATPGRPPQVFELGQDVTINPPVGPPGTANVQGFAPTATAAPAATSLTSDASSDVRLAGAVSAVKVGDRVLLLPINPPNSTAGFALATVAHVFHEKDPTGANVTRLTLGQGFGLSKIKDVTQYRLMRTDQTAQVWPYPADTGFVLRPDPANSTTRLLVDLASIVRGIAVGGPVVLENLGGWSPTGPWCGSLIRSLEQIWYANPKGYPAPAPDVFQGVDPSIPPPASTGAPTIPIPIPHTQLAIAWDGQNSPTDSPTGRPDYLLRLNWKEIGHLIVSPPAQIGGTTSPGASGASGTPATSTVSVRSPDGSAFPVPGGSDVLVEDVIGHGAAGVVDTVDPSTVDLTDPVPKLVPPLRTLVNLLPVTRGKTVTGEILGSGNALVPGQDFPIQNAPVTYLPDPGSKSGDGYGSTVRVWVNGLEWAEVRSFYGQAANAQVFVTREDQQGTTHVVFGDGTDGSRLPTGVNNVVADYRYGAGASSPPAGSLTVVLQPWPGLRAIRNPVAVGGGSDPDPPALIRLMAPRSVLTLGRAVSVDDFEAIAAAAPGVARATAALAFDPISQRPRVTVWVGDDANAVLSARAALAGASDPNRPALVQQAVPVRITLTLSLLVDPRYQVPTVRAAVHSALIDPESGLFGSDVVGIGQAFYDSQVDSTCLAVPGVVSVTSLTIALAADADAGVSYRRKVSEFTPVDPTPTPTPAAPSGCNQRHDPGPGAYFRLDDDPAYLILDLETATP